MGFVLGDELPLLVKLPDLIAWEMDLVRFAEHVPFSNIFQFSLQSVFILLPVEIQT